MTHPDINPYAWPILINMGVAPNGKTAVVARELVIHRAPDNSIHLSLVANGAEFGDIRLVASRTAFNIGPGAQVQVITGLDTGHGYEIFDNQPWSLTPAPPALADAFRQRLAEAIGDHGLRRVNLLVQLSSA